MTVPSTTTGTSATASSKVPRTLSYNYPLPVDENQELYYFQNEQDATARGNLSLKGALVSQLTKIKDKEFAFSIQLAPPSGKTFFFATDSFAESYDWRKCLVRVSRRLTDIDTAHQGTEFVEEEKTAVPTPLARKSVASVTSPSPQKLRNPQTIAIAERFMQSAKAGPPSKNPHTDTWFCRGATAGLFS